MSFGLTPGKLGFRLSDVLVGLADGTEDTPEAIKTTGGRAHFVQYLWNPTTLSYEVATPENLALPLSLILDEASATVSYVGEAAAGTTQSAAAWRIKRITTSGGSLTIEWADGNTNFDNIWANRVALTYS